jgi:hypothetical protein
VTTIWNTQSAAKALRGIWQGREVLVWVGGCLDLSKVLASSLRQKLLIELSKTREIQVMKLVSKVNSTYKDVNRNLLILAKENIIINEIQVKVKHGRVRVIRLNRESPKTALLLQALKTLELEKKPPL